MTAPAWRAESVGKIEADPFGSQEGSANSTAGQVEKNRTELNQEVQDRFFYSFVRELVPTNIPEKRNEARTEGQAVEETW